MVLTLVLPFLILQEKNQILAIVIDIFWAIFVICLFGLQIAAVEYSTPVKTMFKQLAVAMFVGALTFCGSRLVNLIIL